MKHLLTAALLFIASFASAQIVNIPDPVFKQALVTMTSPIIDTNGDGEIQVSEALAVTNIPNLDVSAVVDMTGIRAFENLRSLHVAADRSTTGLYHIDVSGCTNLEYLECLIYDNNFPPSVNTISLDNLPRLKSFVTINQTNFKRLDFRSCDSLNSIYMAPVQSALIEKIDISGLTMLETVHFASVDTLIARNCTGLKDLGGSDTWGTSYAAGLGHVLDVTGCINLRSFEAAYGTTATELDFSSCINLKRISMFEYIDHLTHLNLKNGHYIDTLSFSSGQLPYLPAINICVDEFEVDSVRHMAERWTQGSPHRPYNINAYCSFLPGGTYNTIRGKAKIDLNTNGCDNNDPGMQLLPILFSDTSGQSLIRYTNTTGDYAVYTYKGLFTENPYFPYPYFSISPTSVTIPFDTANNLVNTTDFCITPTGIHNDLLVTFLPIGNARPGFGAAYQLVYKNRGNTILSGNVQLNFDNSKVLFSGASTPANTQSAGQATWNYTNLQPFETHSFYVWLNILPPPVNNDGDTLMHLAVITPNNNDETPDDNSFVLPQILRGSFDPNDKLCAEGEKTAISSLNKPLHYTIHFQNIGTDTAFNVVVADTLTNNVDWNSFDFISSSHPCHITRRNNKLEFYFENIKLPYQAINDAGSNGFVSFQVKPKNTLVVGDSINNTASIYFDFNLPVVTNKTTTVVSLMAPVPVKLEYFSLSSKEESNLLTWKVSTTDLTTIFNIERSSDGIHFNNIGNITANAQRCQLPFNFTDDKPLNGKNYYRIKITDANGVSFYSKILVTGKTKSGFEINAVVSNQNNTTLYLNVSKDQTVQMKIIGADGRLAYSQSKTIAAGTNTLNLQTGNLPKGIYTLVAYTNDGEIVTKRFIK